MYINVRYQELKQFGLYASVKTLKLHHTREGYYPFKTYFMFRYDQSHTREMHTLTDLIYVLPGGFEVVRHTSTNREMIQYINF